MDCSRTSLSNSASSEFSNTDRLTGNSTVEPTSKSLNDGSNKENKVRKRTAYSQAQLKELHTYFNQNAYLDSPQIGHISRRLGITRNQVRKWFQNMRMKRKKQMNVSTQEFQSSKMCHPSVLSPSVTHGVAQPTVTLQQNSWTNTTHAFKRNNQSWGYYSHLHKQQKIEEFPNGNYRQATIVPTYPSPYLEPSAFQSNYRMDQPWNMSSIDNQQQQQNIGNYQAGLLYGYPEANSLTREHTIFTQL